MRFITKHTERVEDRERQRKREERETEGGKETQGEAGEMKGERLRDS